MLRGSGKPFLTGTFAETRKRDVRDVMTLLPQSSSHTHPIGAHLLHATGVAQERSNPAVFQPATLPISAVNRIDVANGEREATRSRREQINRERSCAGFRRQHLDRELSNRREPQPAGARSLHWLVASDGT